MWFDQPPTPSAWDDATRHLMAVEPRLAKVIRRVGPCLIFPRRDYFNTLCKAVFSQQVSVKAAATMFSRFRDQFPSRRITPARVFHLLTNEPGAQQRCGLSRQKFAYLIDLADHFVANKIPTRSLRGMSDEQVIEALVAVKGVGRWTAEMFLIFVLNRTDVLPVDDLGLRDGIRDIFELPERPTAKQMIEMAEPWRPYRSIATWYIWRRHGAGGVATPEAGAADATAAVIVEAAKTVSGKRPVMGKRPAPKKRKTATAPRAS